MMQASVHHHAGARPRSSCFSRSQTACTRRYYSNRQAERAQCPYGVACALAARCANVCFQAMNDAGHGSGLPKFVKCTAVACQAAGNDAGAAAGGSGTAKIAELERDIKEVRQLIVKKVTAGEPADAIRPLETVLNSLTADLELLRPSQGAAAPGRKPAEQAVRLWWQFLPQAQVEKVSVEVPEELEEEAGSDDVQAEMLRLAGGTTFPGSKGPNGKPLSALLRRKCYHTITAECFKAAETGPKKVLVIGTPGAGKSFSAYELLYQLRLANKTVLWQRRTSPNVLLLCPDGTAWSGSLSDFDEERQSPNVWYICDGTEPAAAYANTVLITSPRMDNINEFIKEDYVQLWVGIWNWAELVAARELIYPAVSAAHLLKRVLKVGRLPRYALQQACSQVVLDGYIVAIKTCNAKLVEQAVGNFVAAPAASNELVHLEANDDCKLVSYVWASPWVEEEVMNRLVQKDLDGMEIFVRDYKGVDSVRGLRAAQFQRLCGAWISSGGELLTRSLDDPNRVETLQLPVQSMLDIDELPSQLQPNHYYRFKPLTFPAVDAVSVLSSKAAPNAPLEVILWQTTVAATHDVAAVQLHKTVLKPLLSMQGKVVIRGLYFAVPADVFDLWDKRQAQKRTERTDASSVAARQAFQQQQQLSQAKKTRGRPSKQQMDEAELQAAVDALAGIHQYVVKIPAKGVSERWQQALKADEDQI